MKASFFTLFLAAQYVLSIGTKRVVKKEYSPYGPKMCEWLCRDSFDSFVYSVHGLKCWRRPRNDSGTRDITRCLEDDGMAPNSTTSNRSNTHERCYLTDEELPTLHNGTASTGEHNYSHLLHQACRAGNLCMVQYILSQRLADIDSRGRNGQTPVMVAALKGHYAVFEYLVGQACDLNVTRSMDTILHLACRGGNTDIVRKLLSDGKYNIETRGEIGMTPVMVAAYFCHIQVFYLLVNAGCKLKVFDTYNDSILHIACKGGCVELVMYILSNNLFSIEVKGNYGRTPLMVAAMKGHIRVVQRLVAERCNLRAVDSFNNSVLHVSCIGGHTEIVKYFLDHKLAGIDEQGFNGKTAAMIAAESGHRAVVNLLIKKGCNLKAHDKFHENILHKAIRGRHEDIVDLILSLGIVSIESKGRMGKTPLLLGAAIGHKGILQMLTIKGSNLTATDMYQNTILHVACMNGHVNVVKYILKQNCIDIESRGFSGRTAAMIAAWWGYKGVFDFLVSKECNLRVIDRYQNNILHAASMGGNANIVKYILKQNIVDIDSRGFSGRTPLMTAAASGQKETFDFLVSKGASLTAVDSCQSSILHIASMGGQVNMVKYILEQSYCEIETQGFLGRTPLMTATEAGKMEVFTFLVSKGCSVEVTDKHNNSILHIACMNGYVNIVKLILEQNYVDIECPGYLGRTPVMEAAEKGCEEVFDFLVSKGCRMNVEDEYQQSILHVACKGGNVDIVNHILEHHVVDIDKQGFQKATPLMTAAKCGQKKIVDILIAKGCNTNVTTNDGYNILHLACVYGQVDMVEHILYNSIFDAESKSKLGLTPIMTAALFGRKEVVEFFAKNNCNLKSVTVAGDSILHLACISKDVATVKYLISLRDVDRTCRNRYGKIPLQVAKEMGASAIVSLLLGKN